MVLSPTFIYGIRPSLGPNRARLSQRIPKEGKMMPSNPTIGTAGVIGLCVGFKTKNPTCKHVVMVAVSGP